jgi:hypothetical protein
MREVGSFHFANHGANTFLLILGADTESADVALGNATGFSEKLPI